MYIYTTLYIALMSNLEYHGDCDNWHLTKRVGPGVGHLASLRCQLHPESGYIVVQYREA